MTNVTERRSYPRASVAVDFSIKSGEHLLSASTENISAKGLYCPLNHHIPLFTKLGICLMIPSPNDTTGEEMEAISCDGVVVRVEKSLVDDNEVFNTAIFFTHIDPAAVEKLQDYVKMHPNR